MCGACFFIWEDRVFEFVSETEVHLWDQVFFFISLQIGQYLPVWTQVGVFACSQVVPACSLVRQPRQINSHYQLPPPPPPLPPPLLPPLPLELGELPNTESIVFISSLNWLLKLLQEKF